MELVVEVQSNIVHIQPLRIEKILISSFSLASCLETYLITDIHFLRERVSLDIFIYNT